MEFNTSKKQALLYLDRNGFYYYEVGLPTVLSLSFLPASVKDLDLMDEKSLDNQIQAFFTQNKLSQSNITIVISPNIIFEKDIFIVDPIPQKEEIDKFIDTVPFANVSTSNFPIDKGMKVIGVNEDLFLAIKNSFEKLGCVASLVLPYHALGSDAALLNNFSADNLTQFIKKVDHLRPSNLLKLRILETPILGASTPNAQKPPLINKRVIIMGGVLMLLIGIMIFMLINMK